MISLDDQKPKDYKKPTILAVIITAAALLVSLLSLSLKGIAAVPAQGIPAQNDTTYYTPKPDASQETASDPLSESEGPYRITIYQGKIGVFQKGETEPCLTADVDVYLLPKEDVDLLRAGINAENLKEAKQILEDYE